MRERRPPAAGGGFDAGLCRDARAAPRLLRKPEALSAFPLRRAIFWRRVSLLLSPGAPGPGRLPALPCLLLPARASALLLLQPLLRSEAGRRIFFLSYVIYLLRIYPGAWGKERELPLG